jgi:hypothetical protein
MSKRITLALPQPCHDAMFGRARADVAQLVEQRFRNPVFAPREILAPSHRCEHARLEKNKTERGTVNMVTIAPQILLVARGRTRVRQPAYEAHAFSRRVRGARVDDACAGRQ